MKFKKFNSKQGNLNAINEAKTEMGLLIEKRNALDTQLEERKDSMDVNVYQNKTNELQELDKEISQLRNTVNHYNVEYELVSKQIDELNDGMEASNTYLRSDEAITDFAKALADSRTKDEFTRNWNDNVKSRAISFEGDAPIPIQIGEILDDYAKTSGTIYSNVSVLKVDGKYKSPYETLKEGARGDNRADKLNTRKTGQNAKFAFVEITCQDIYKFIDVTKQDSRDFKQIENWIRTELPKRYFFTIEQAMTIGDGLADSDESKITSFQAMHDSDATFATPVQFTAYDEYTLDNLARKVKTDGIKVLIGNEEDYYDLKAIKDATSGFKSYATGTAPFGNREFNTIGGFIFIPKTFMPITNELETGEKGLIMVDLKSYLRCEEEPITFYTDNTITKNFKTLMVEGCEGGALVQPNSCSYLIKEEA